MIKRTDDKIIHLKSNLPIVLWLLNDMCWLLSFRWMGTLLAIPTLLVTFYITYQSKSDKWDFFHQLAICNWIIAHEIWKIGDFFFKDSFRPYAIIFFFSGLLFFFYPYLNLMIYGTKKNS